MKRAMPTTNTWRRPSRSPIRAPSSSRPPKVERVDVLDPGEAGGGEAEVGADVGQRGDHHRGVEDDHQVAAEDDREHHRRVGGPRGPARRAEARFRSWEVMRGKSFGEVGGVLKWSHPPGNSEGASASMEHYTEAASVLSRKICRWLCDPRHHDRPDLTALAARPKRADARRNYDKLVAAAREVFAEQGTDATLEEISRRAGVGIGTLYRHFPARENLVEAAYLDGVEEVCAAVATHDGEEPWEALTGWLLEFVAFAATKRVLADEMFAVHRPRRPRLQVLRRRHLRRRRAAAAARPGGGRRPRRRRHRPTSPRWSAASPACAPSRPTRSNASSRSPSTASARPPRHRIRPS